MGLYAFSGRCMKSLPLGETRVWPDSADESAFPVASPSMRGVVDESQDAVRGDAGIGWRLDRERRVVRVVVWIALPGGAGNIDGEGVKGERVSVTTESAGVLVPLARKRPVSLSLVPLTVK